MTELVSKIVLRMTEEEKTLLEKQAIIEVRSLNVIIRNAIKKYCKE